MTTPEANEDSLNRKPLGREDLTAEDLQGLMREIENRHHKLEQAENELRCLPSDISDREALEEGLISNIERIRRELSDKERLLRSIEEL